jgi:CRISPR system Cascade subunit CasA
MADSYPTPLSLSLAKAPWRDLHALVAAQEGTKRPDAVSFVARMVAQGVLERRRLHTLHVVGLASAANRAAKLLLWRHDRMPVPAAVIESVDLTDFLKRSIAIAQETAKALRDRVWRVCQLFLSPTSDQAQGRKPKPEDVSQFVDAYSDRNRPPIPIESGH